MMIADPAFADGAWGIIHAVPGIEILQKSAPYVVIACRPCFDLLLAEVLLCISPAMCILPPSILHMLVPPCAQLVRVDIDLSDMFVRICL
jgi:hypothetical protein